MTVENRSQWPSNPRERRAFAHAMIAQSRRNPSDLKLSNLTEEAVKAAGDSRKSRDSGFKNALLPKAVMFNGLFELGTSEPMSEETAKALLREILLWSQTGYKSTDIGIKVKTLPSSRVTVVIQTEIGRTLYPTSPYANVVISDHEGRAELHFIHPATANDWLKRRPVATETFGQSVLAALQSK